MNPLLITVFGLVSTTLAMPQYGNGNSGQIGNLNNNGFPTGNFGKKYKVHLPKKYSSKPVDAVVVPVPFTESFNANTREVK